MGLAKFIKQIPGVRGLWRRLTESPNHSGEWIYQQGIVGWLYQPQLRRQLPWSYRWFAWFCRCQCPFSPKQIIGGQTFLRAVIGFNRWRNGRAHVGLKLDHATVFINLRDPRMLQAVNELLHPGAEEEALRTLLGEADTFLDVGANHGSFSIFAAQQLSTAGRIVAVEPQPDMAELVRQSLAANARCPFEVGCFACGDRAGTVDFYIPKSTSGTAGVFQGFSAVGAHDKLTVELKKFDDAFAWREFPGGTFLKLDVEGSELAFLRGAEQMLRARRPKILLELNPKSSRAAGVSVEETIQFLQGVGYTSFAELKFPLAPQPLASAELQRQRNIIVLP